MHELQRKSFRTKMELHPVRKQPPCRTLLLFLAGTSLLLFFMAQASVRKIAFLNPQQSNPRMSSAYPSRRIQDYEVDSDNGVDQQPPFLDQNTNGETEDPDAMVENRLLGAAPEHKVTLTLLENNILRNTLDESLQKILVAERNLIRKAMSEYSFHPALKARSLDGLVLESGGEPVRSLVITTWRSGSTFIGDILQSHPATYYHYEPLLDFGISQVRHGAEAKKAVRNLRHLLTCDYNAMEHYLNYGESNRWVFMHNQRLWAYCNAFPHICWNPKFLTPFCKLFPFQSMKTVRLRLNLTTELLQDKQLGVQVLLLVRDPRGTMQSRRHRDWCPGKPDCDDPAWLCQDLVSDFYTAKRFQKQFPHSFRMIRYEDLSFNAYNMTRELFDFFHLSYHPKVRTFLDTHTKHKIGGVSSTFRNSKVAPVHWQQDLSWKDVKQIQSVCGEALRLWGYKIAKNETHLRSFNPVEEFKTIL